MFGDLSKSVTVYLDYDPAADDVLPVWRVPHRATIKAAYWTSTNAVAASGSVYYSLALLNGGTAGTATDAISSTVGGTAASGTAPGWGALTPTALPITDGAVDAGELVVLSYDENTTGTFTAGVLQIDYVDGIGANA